MIDTIGFKIVLTDDEFLAVQKKGKERIEKDNTLGTIIKRRYKDNIYIGSYDHHVNYWCDDKDGFFLELSIPKFFYGNNILLLYPSQLDQALDRIYHSLLSHFGAFPHYKKWSLQRLDICYAWRYQDQETAERVLSVLQKLEQPRKHRQLYKTSVEWIGEKYSTKFYLKKPEFLKHDFKRILKQDPERAYNLLELASGVLRFELTFHNYALSYLIEDKEDATYEEVLKNDFIPRTLIEYMKKLIGNFGTETMQSEEIAKRLVDCYGKVKGMRRYFVYELYFSPDANKRQVLNNLYTRSTIWRYKKDLEEANITILPIYDVSSDINIPSEFVVNPDPAISR